jgi:hypothetical protein
MKIRNIILVAVIIIAFLSLLGSCATTRKAISEYDLFKTLSGTWVNTEYEYKGGQGPPQKIVFFPDGRFEFYNKATYDTPSIVGRALIMEGWIDSKGNIWYKNRTEVYNASVYEIGKISNSGNTREIIVSGIYLTIEDWNPDNPKKGIYGIYYRQ